MSYYTVGKCADCGGPLVEAAHCFPQCFSPDCPIDWRARAEKAEAELARLKSMSPVQRKSFEQHELGRPLVARAEKAEAELAALQRSNEKRGFEVSSELEALESRAEKAEAELANEAIEMKRLQRQSVDNRARADQYERDWYAAKSEFGTAMAKVRARAEKAEADLRAARQDALSRETVLSAERNLTRSWEKESSAQCARAEAAEKRAAALETWVRDHAEHTSTCMQPCTCGRSALLVPTVTP